MFDKMIVIIFVIILFFITGIFYLAVRKYYISKKYMIKTINDDKNDKSTKIRGDYIDIVYDGERAHVYKGPENKWYRVSNDNKEQELEVNTVFCVGNKQFKIISEEKSGGFLVLLPIYVTMMAILLLLWQGCSIIASEEDETKFEEDIHSFVLKNDNLFQNNISIDWKEYKTGRKMRRSLKNGKSEVGISVSEHQENINWKKVKKDGIDYALIRIGRRGYETGNLKMDTKFNEYMDNAIANNIKVGGYFYSQAISKKEMDEELKQIFKSIKKYTFDYPIGISLERDEEKRTEDLSDEEYIDLIKYFCIKMEQNGYTPMIMEREKWFKQFPKVFNGYLKLVSNETAAPSDIDNCIIWEYEENADGVVNGINVNSEIELSISAYIAATKTNDD